MPAESRLSREADGLGSLAEEIRRLMPIRANCRRVAVISAPTGHLGRWQSDTELLLEAFPAAQIAVYASEDAMWQVQDLDKQENNQIKSGTDAGGPRLSLRFVGSLHWFSVVCRELLRFGTPTIVLWRGAYGVGLQQKHQKLIKLAARLSNAVARLFFPLRSVYFAKTLRDFCGVLNEELEAARLTGRSGETASAGWANGVSRQRKVHEAR
jgi:hypothetical protein